MALSALLVLAGVTALSVVLASRKGQAPVLTECAVATSTGAAYQLAPQQAQNAAIIAGVALKMGLPDHAVTVALATALQESRLQDLTYGDLDSVGLFQQRPSEGWGTRRQILDPVYATTAFYGRLIQVPGWQSMAVTEAAQSVQRSAAPTAYADWEDEARALASALTGEAPAGFTCQLAGFRGGAPSPSALTAASTTEMGAPLIGTAVTTKTGWRVASWAVAHAWQYHVTQVTFDGWRWTPRSGRWARTTAATAAGSVVRLVTQPQPSQ